MTLKAFIVRYKRLVAFAGIFVLLLLTYFLLGDNLTTYWQTTVQGHTVTAKHIAQTIIWLAAWWVVAMLVDVVVWENIVYRRTGNPIPQLLKSTVNLLILLVVIICIVAIVYQKSITGLLATTGALGIVVGLSLRGVIENAVQGVALNIERPFKTGDLITIPGKVDDLAMVKDITYRNTYIEDTYGRIIAVPNSVICSNVVKNYSRFNSQLFSITFSITLGIRDMSSQDVLRILQAVVSTPDFIGNDPRAQVYISEVHSYDVTYEIAVWVYRNKSNPTDAKHILCERIIAQLLAAGFVVGRPYVDHEGIEQQLATILHEVDAFENLSPDEKDKFYDRELLSKRSLRVLRQVTLFSQLNKEELVALSEHINVRNYRQGETLIEQGDSGDEMYILVEGVLQIYINAPDNKERIPVAKLIPSQYFGEMSLLVGDKRSATIVALSDVELYEINRETMSNLFKTHPDFIEKISEKIVEQKMINFQKITEYSTREIAQEKRKFVKEFVSRIKLFFTKKSDS